MTSHRAKKNPRKFQAIGINYRLKARFPPCELVHATLSENKRFSRGKRA